MSVLRDRTYRRLFTAQVIALVGTGLATVALSRSAYDLEMLFSPAPAAALLTVVGYNWLFLGTVGGSLPLPSWW